VLDDLAPYRRWLGRLPFNFPEMLCWVVQHGYVV